jgi:tRNA (cmo5U34)-methyltransferase
VPVPDTVPQHLERLGDIGFKRAELWFQFFNFISMAAFK